MRRHIWWNKIKGIRFLLGLILILLGFLVGHAKEIPFVERLIAPKAYFVHQGLDRLENEKILEKNTPAFKYILDICLPGGIGFEEITALSKGTTTLDTRKINEQSSFGIHLIISNNKESSDPVCSSRYLKNKVGYKSILVTDFSLSLLGYMIK